MKKITLFLLLFSFSHAHATEYYKLIVYHFSTISQEKKLDDFFEQQLVPSLHRKGFSKVGVFKPITNDTAKDKQIILLVNGDDLKKMVDPIQWNLSESSPYNDPMYNRYEQIILRAFKQMPNIKFPNEQSKRGSRIFELRSYESPTETTYLNKVHMFNEGGEIQLFKQLEFNAVFYADVLVGSRMPNLMYMTSFDNLESRNAHWKSFGESPIWKNLSTMPFYQHNMSALHSQLLQTTAYSDY